MIAIIAFTQNGIELANCLAQMFDAKVYEKPGDLSNLVKEQMQLGNPIIFVGACGIAVRTIAPFIEDKTKDVPVVVVDELGMSVIPILSGHLGGANELAKSIASQIGAYCAITTATDLNGVFAVDIFAKDLNLAITNPCNIKKISAKAINREKISILIDDETISKKTIENVLSYNSKSKYELLTELISKNSKGALCDILITNNESLCDEITHSILLREKLYFVGMGCKKEKGFEELLSFYESTLDDLNIPSNEVAAIATIDIKKDERGLNLLANKMRVPLLTFSSEKLLEAAGDFSASAFVENTVGVDNVCERAAKLASGGELILKKISSNGMTIAIAKANCME